MILQRKKVYFWQFKLATRLRVYNYVKNKQERADTVAYLVVVFCTLASTGRHVLLEHCLPEGLSLILNPVMLTTTKHSA
jgi:hypothetical protein